MLAPMAKKKAEEKPVEAPPPIPGRGTADGDTLREALHAFDAGDYVAVRELTGDLAKSDDDEVRAAAEELAQRIGVDPVQVVVLLACVAVLLTIYWVWVF